MCRNQAASNHLPASAVSPRAVSSKGSAVCCHAQREPIAANSPEKAPAQGASTLGTVHEAPQEHKGTSMDRPDQRHGGASPDRNKRYEALRFCYAVNLLFHKHIVCLCNL